MPQEGTRTRVVRFYASAGDAKNLPREQNKDILPLCMCFSAPMSAVACFGEAWLISLSRVVCAGRINTRLQRLLLLQHVQLLDDVLDLFPQLLDRGAVGGVCGREEQGLVSSLGPPGPGALQQGRPRPTFLPAPSRRRGLLPRALRQQQKAKQGADVPGVHDPPRGTGKPTLRVHGGETVRGAAASQCGPRRQEPDS